MSAGVTMRTFFAATSTIATRCSSMCSSIGPTARDIATSGPAARAAFSMKRNAMRRIAAKDSARLRRPRCLARAVLRLLDAHEGLGFVGRHRFAEEVTLHVIAGIQFQERPLLFRFHAFRDYREAQRVREVDHV